MKIKEGYVYHIKEEYFKVVRDEKLMKNHEGNFTRPNYFCIKLDNSEILWFVENGHEAFFTIEGEAEGVFA